MKKIIKLQSSSDLKSLLIIVTITLLGITSSCHYRGTPDLPSDNDSAKFDSARVVTDPDSLDKSQRMLSSAQNFVNQGDYKSASEIIDSLLLDKLQEKVRDEVLDKVKELLNEHQQEFQQAEQQNSNEAADDQRQYNETIRKRVLSLTRNDLQNTELQEQLIKKLTNGRTLEESRRIVALGSNVSILHDWLNEMSDNRIIDESEVNKYVPLCTCTE
jgi:hypothetical protein